MEKIKFRPIIVDNSKQELTEHGSIDFPCSMDMQEVSREKCAYIPHWHYEIQISVVIKGSVLFRTPIGDFRIKKGEGLFINRGILHEVMETEDNDSLYICVNFRPELIYGQANNVIRRDYVDPVIFNADIQAFALNSAPWHRQICNMILKMACINEKQEYGYRLEIKIILCKIWLLILKNYQEKLISSRVISVCDMGRTEDMLSFIHKNYMDKLALADIARSAQISSSECCRLFKHVLHIRPMSYLVQHRIMQSIKLLTCTDLKISTIAQEVGFSTGSYYTACFKKEMSCTPISYRKQHEVKKKDVP